MWRTDIVFDLTKAQETAFKNGDLAIYHYNSANHSWAMLPAFAVRIQTGSYRVTAVAPALGGYGLGELK